MFSPAISPSRGMSCAHHRHQTPLPLPGLEQDCCAEARAIETLYNRAISERGNKMKSGFACLIAGAILILAGSTKEQTSWLLWTTPGRTKTGEEFASSISKAGKILEISGTALCAMGGIAQFINKE